MATRVPAIMHVKQLIRRSVVSGKEAASTAKNVPKGYFAVYVGENQKKRFILPISYLNEPSFQKLLNKAEEEFGFDHPMGGLTIPCREEAEQIFKQMQMAREAPYVSKGKLEKLRGGALRFQLHPRSIFYLKAKPYGWYSQNPMQRSLQ